METKRSTKTTWLVVMVLALFLTLVSIDNVNADNGPHGGYTATTDACAGCHRAHTAPSSNLLLNPIPGLCYSCHGNAGTGADTNVIDGVYLERDGIGEFPSEGVAGQALKGGGFINAIMDTDRDGTAVSIPATSNHIVDSSTGVAWGNGAIGSGAGLAIQMSCASCHDPHGGESYRILRPIPIDSGAAAPVTVPDETDKIYTVTEVNNDYMSENYGSLGPSLASWCSQCHTRYLASSGSGHTDSGDSIFTYRHTTTSISCVKCHVAHGSSATMGINSGSVLWPDSAATPNGDQRSSLLRMDNRGVCAFCHLSSDGSVGGGACDSCHGAPPTTGAHLAHSGSGAVGYGLTGSFATDAAYEYGCGECHPADSIEHMNGVVDIDLSPVGAPAGSLKSQNDVTAVYAANSCGSVYCHSGIEVTSGPVGLPLIGGDGNYILDPHNNPTYDPYTVTETRIFQTTPAWNGGQITTCDACHEFPLTTAFPAVEAGVGSSHQWIDDSGYGNLHAFNHGFDPFPCRTCHYGEIVEANTWSRVGSITTYDPVSLASRIAHADGQRDVAFDTVNPVVYNSTSYMLDAAAYIPAENACTNVACHKLQNYVQWGAPYRWWTNECDVCHRYSGLWPPPPPLGVGNSEAQDVGIEDNAHASIDLEKQMCVSCHIEPHGEGN